MPMEELKNHTEIDEAINAIEQCFVGSNKAISQERYEDAWNELDHALAIADQHHLRKQYESKILHDMQSVNDLMNGVERVVPKVSEQEQQRSYKKAA